MKYIIKTLLFIFVVLLFPGTVSAEKANLSSRIRAMCTDTNLSSEDRNPLLEMVGKPYAEYHDTYMQVVGSLLHGDSLSRTRLVALFEEAAAFDKSGEWKLVNDLVANTVRFYNSRRGGFIWSSDYTAEDFSTDMKMLARRAEQKNFPFIRIYGLYQAAEGYRIFVKDYEQAFDCFLKVAAMLDSVTTKEFPPRPYIYNEIANLYYNFREYNDAIKYYEKVAADPDVTDNYYGSLNPAISGMALSYRNGFRDYDRSDSCFMALLKLTRAYEPDRVVWEGITEANIGYNFYLRKQPDMALKWLLPGIDKITRPNDFGCVSSRATDVAEIYLEKRELKAAKKYIDMALDYHARTRIPEKESRLYEVLARYYAVTGNQKAAAIYLDSTLMAKDKEAEAFSGLVLRRVEQRLRAADQKLNDHKIESEQARSRMYRHTTILTGTALVIILLLLGLILYFYRRTRNAYRKLVRRSQQWAGIKVPDTEQTGAEDIQPEDKQALQSSGEKEVLPVDIEETICDDGHLAAETGQPAIDTHDAITMAEVEKAMTERKVYKRTDLTLDTLAQETGFNRYYLSNALNRCTGKNFNSYVNEFRVKEAIRIMSEPGGDDLTVDAIAFEVGFNDRQSLYRVFKKITGISPKDFRKNKSE